MALSHEKHIMLSYNWNSQGVVSQIYRILVDTGIKTWMDVNGGMGDNINTSMAAAVENSIVVCCFLTPEYQESRNCRLELEYAHTLKKRIIPCMLSDKNGKKWTPSDWLGLITTGANYINMRDQSQSNIQSKAQELIDRIRNNPSAQAAASGSQRDHLLDLIRQEYIQNSFIHRIINEEKCFPIEQSYINLAIVQNEEQLEKEKKLSQIKHNDTIIGTFEEIYGAKTVIDVKDMFKKCKDGKQKILVLGRAGIGKSTFCRYVTYRWAKGEIWTQYQLVILIKLRMLTNNRYPPGHDYSPFDLLKKEYASHIIMREEDRPHFEEQCRKGQVLWLLDGYDEFVQNIPEQLQDVFNLIINKYPHVLTSRPYSITLSYDVKMEITGFTDDNIAKYIEQFFTQISDQLEDAASEGHQLKTFLESYPSIWGIAHIPVNLELICSLWGDIDRSQTTILTMTELYDNITEWLLRRYLLKQKNHLQMNIDAMSIEDVNRCCQKELMFMETLAFNAMKSSTLILQPSALGRALADADVTEEDKKTYLQYRRFEVIQCFQEYFAARHLVKNLRSSTNQDSIEFIRHNKYNQRFTLVFVFASGLLASEDLSVKRRVFWDALFDEPVDLIGFRHMQILISCLEEVSDKSTIPHYSVIIENLSQWIKHAASHSSKQVVQKMYHSLKRSIALSLEPIIQDQLINSFENSDSHGKLITRDFISALSTYNVNPEHLLLLTRALEDENYDVRGSACYALGNMGEKAATSGVINKLVSVALEDEHSVVRQYGCYALGNMGKNAATSDVVNKLGSIALNDVQYVRTSACDALAKLGEKGMIREVTSKLVSVVLNDELGRIRDYAYDALAKMGEKEAARELIDQLVSALDNENGCVRSGACAGIIIVSQEAPTSAVISKLVSVALHDESEYVRNSACDALDEMSNKAVTSEVISKLVSALDGSNESVRSSACDALAKMGEKAATSEVVSKLVSTLDDENPMVRCRACNALGTMGEKVVTNEMISKLVNTTDDKNEYVRARAYYALTGMGKALATNKVIDKLVNALNDEDNGVRISACYALARMGEKAATSEVISKLVSALNCQNERVRRSACDALGNMGEKAATSEVINALITAFDDEDWYVRRAAPCAFDKMGQKVATNAIISKLVSALDDKNKHTKIGACYALAGIGRKVATNEIINKLVSILNDENNDVRISAWYALAEMGEKAATSEVVSVLVNTRAVFDEDARKIVDRWLNEISFTFPVLTGLAPETVEKLLTCIEKNLFEDLTFMSVDTLIEVYLHTRWSSWLSVAVLVALLQGAAVTTINDTVVVYSSREPVELHDSNGQALEQLVEAFLKQADKFGLPCMRLRKSFVPIELEETIVSSSGQISVVDAK